MRIVIIFAIMVILTITFMIFINENVNNPSNKYEEEACSRYCHNQSCKHFIRDKEDKKYLQTTEQLYFSNIRWLRENPFGLSYRAMNILVYVILFPSIWGILIWRISRR